MNNRKKEKQTFHSMKEIEKKYLPKSFKEKVAKASKDSHKVDISFAKEYLKEIDTQLIE